MKTKDLTGMTFGSLDVLKFDEDRYVRDKQLHSNGQLGKVRRHYICCCSNCGKLCPFVEKTWCLETLLGAGVTCMKRQGGH